MNPAHESFGSARRAGMIDIIMRRIFYKKRVSAEQGVYEIYDEAQNRS